MFSSEKAGKKVFHSYFLWSLIVRLQFMWKMEQVATSWHGEMLFTNTKIVHPVTKYLHTIAVAEVTERIKSSMNYCTNSFLSLPLCFYFQHNSTSRFSVNKFDRWSHQESDGTQNTGCGDVEGKRKWTKTSSSTKQIDDITTFIVCNKYSWVNNYELSTSFMSFTFRFSSIDVS